MVILHLFWVCFLTHYEIFKMKKNFYVAAYKDHQEIVKELLNNNADIEAKDYDGNTPLFLVFSYLIVGFNS